MCHVLFYSGHVSVVCHVLLCSDQIRHVSVMCRVMFYSDQVRHVVGVPQSEQPHSSGLGHGSP